MLDSPVVDVVIGLTFLFLMFSFCATAVVEALSEWRQWRGRLLHAKLETILGSDFVMQFYCERRVADLASGAAPVQASNSTHPSLRLTARLAAPFERLLRPLSGVGEIASFSTTSLVRAQTVAERMNATRLPSYIPESVFADVMLDWLQGISLPQALHPDSSGSSLLLYDQAELWARMNRRADGDQTLLREELVRWYRQTTERIGGEYRRKIRVALYAVGLVIVVALNLDAVRMATRLYDDPALRDRLVAAGEQVVIDCPDGVTECDAFRTSVRETAKEVVVNASSDIVGWNLPDMPHRPELTSLDSWKRFGAELLSTIAQFWAQVGPAALVGWVITILAIGMGADFWFGLLKRIVAIRNSEKDAAGDGLLPVDAAAAPQPDTPAPRSAVARDPLDIASPDLAPLKGFQPLRFAESNVHAFWLGHFASLAYSQEKELNASELLARHGLTARAFDVGGTQVFLFTSEAVSILAFRGTEPAAEDWITDARLEQLANPWAIGNDALKVHRGFHDALDQVWEPLRAALAATKAPLWITGHSLGGALAILAAYRLATGPRDGMPTIGGVYTFGQPRAGNTEFANRCPPELAQRIFRFVNASDIVPLVPPTRIASYAHLGHFRYFDGTGRLHHERTLWERIAERLTPAIALIGSKDADWKKVALDHARERIEHHSMSRYIECLERIDAVRALRTTA